MKRTVKIKANCSNNEDEILLIGTIQRNIKNYVWSRYSGIGSLLKQSGWTIRDELIQKDLLSKKITKTFSRTAIEQSAATIKTNWIITKKKVKKAIKQNENLTEDDKSYLYLCLKHTPTLYGILNYKKVDYQTDYLKDLKVNVHRLNNLLRRYVRKEIWLKLMEYADEVKTYEDKNPGKSIGYILNARNWGMIEPCEVLIAVYNGDKTGGTANAVKYGLSKKKKIIYIHPDELR